MQANADRRTGSPWPPLPSGSGRLEMPNTEPSVIAPNSEGCSCPPTSPPPNPARRSDLGECRDFATTIQAEAEHAFETTLAATVSPTSRSHRLAIALSSIPRSPERKYPSGRTLPDWTKNNVIAPGPSIKAKAGLPTGRQPDRRRGGSPGQCQSVLEERRRRSAKPRR